MQGRVTERTIPKSYSPYCLFLYDLKLADNVFPYILYIFIVRTRMSAR